MEAISKAARELSPQIVSGRLCGNVAEAATTVVNFTRKAQAGRSKLLIWGGETTVALRGNGNGGRNQELALRFAMQSEDLPGDWVFLAGGTDGIDGPTNATGGLVDRNTTARISAAKGRPTALLDNNDSHNALRLADDLLVTGATGTNVADVAFFLQP